MEIQLSKAEMTGHLTSLDKAIYLFQGRLFTVWGCVFVKLEGQSYWNIMNELLNDEFFLARSKQL